MNPKISRWLDFPTLRPNSAIRLFCFPYAGGSAVIFRQWQKSLPDGVDVCPIQLPGRGTRLREPMMKRLDAVVRELMVELGPYMDRPFAFFGHSMGAMIAFELARALRNELRPQPAKLFVSARRAPDAPPDDECDYTLPDADLVARLRRLNGTPQEILDNADAMAMLLPLVRADFEIVDTYEYRPQPPLPLPIDAFAGSDDVSSTAAQMEDWKCQSTKAFSLTVIPGDHFFIHHAQSGFLDMLAARMKQLLELIHARNAVSIS